METTERNDWVVMVMFCALCAMGCGAQDGNTAFDGGDECADTETYTETVTVPDGTDTGTDPDTETATTVEPPACWEAGPGSWCAPTLEACETGGGTVTAHACAALGVCCHLPAASTLDDPGQCNGYLDPAGLCWLYPQVAGPTANRFWPEIYSQDHAAWCTGTEQIGHDDWREATVDELRPFIVGCPASEVGGACVITQGMIWDWSLVADGGPCAGCPDLVHEHGITVFADANFDFITSTTVFFANGTTGHIYVSPESGRIGVAPGGQEATVPVTPRCVRVPVSGEGT